jgi:hypothetical protein
MSIEERIEVTGGERAKRAFDEVADAQGRVAQSVEDAGNTSEQASTKTDDLGQSALRMIASYVGLDAVLDMFRGLVELLEDAVRLQGELSSKASTFAQNSKTVARQLGVSEEEGAGVVTDVRIAGGLDQATASDLVIASDIAFGKAGLGGYLAGENAETTRQIAAFAGSRAFGSGDAGDLVKLLGLSGALVSPEDAKAAIAKISAAALKSDASSVGAFVGQVLEGGTGLLQQDVPLEEVLLISAQARSGETNEALAAQSVAVLEQVAVAGSSPKFNKEIARVASERGLDPAALTSAQRVGITRDVFGSIDSQAEQNRVAKLLPPEQFLRLLKAFRGSSVAASAPVSQAIASSSPVDFELAVEQGRGEISFRDAQNLAAAEFEEYQAGAERFTIASARNRAKSLVDRDIARGVGRGYGREAEEERYVLAMLKDARDRLAESGHDVAEIDAALGDVDFLKLRVPVLEHFPLIGDFLSGTGYQDSRLNAVASAIDNVRRRSSLDRQAELEQQRAANITVINNGTAYYGEDPLTDPPVPVDAGQ